MEVITYAVDETPERKLTDAELLTGLTELWRYSLDVLDGAVRDRENASRQVRIWEGRIKALCQAMDEVRNRGLRHE